MPAMSDASTRESTPHSAANTAGVVELNVGGIHYTTSLATLRAVDDSFMEIMVREDQMPTATDKDGRIFIDRDGTHFGTILNYLRDLQTPFGVSPDVRRALQAEARFYNIPDLFEWAMRVDDELREAEAATAEIAGTCTDRITASLGVHLETLCRLLQQINLREWGQQARSLSRDALLHLGGSIKDLAVKFLCILPQFAFVFGSLPLCLFVFLRAGHESGPMSINVGGQLVTASRSVLTGNRHAARIAETPFSEGEEFRSDDFMFTGRLYCYANELYAPRWEFLVSRRCNFLVRNFTGERIDQQIASLRTGGSRMGTGEFHAISRCWCAMQQSAPVRDSQGNIFLDRDPDLMHDIVRALRYPEDAIQALRNPGGNSTYPTSGRALFCKEVEYLGIVDFVAPCFDPLDTLNTSTHRTSASALLAFHMMQLAIKDLENDQRDLTHVDIPLEQVVHNRQIMVNTGVLKWLGNPITKSKNRWQAILETVLKNEFICGFFFLFAVILFKVYTTCKPLLAAMKYTYLRLVLSPQLGFAMLGILKTKEYYFNDWDPEDFASLLCPLPQKCHRRSNLLDHSNSNNYEQRRLQQSHICDKTLDFAWHLVHISNYMHVPLILLSVGAISCYMCGLTRALAESSTLFRGMIASWTVWLMRSSAFVIPCLIAVLWFAGISDPIISRDDRRILVFHPSYSLDDFWELVTRNLHALAEISSKLVVDTLYKNSL